jgi:predicted nucleotidyltransferase
MLHGLQNTTIDAINSVFREYQDIDEVILYGSRAKGNYKTGSDIDLVLKGAKLSLTDLLKIENELDDLMLPYKIDVSLYHQINNLELTEHIQRVGMAWDVNF